MFRSSPMYLNALAKDLCPPLLWKSLRTIKRTVAHSRIKGSPEGTQDLDPYWDEEMARLLEEWGTDNVWNEISMFLLEAEGKVLDIACGTGTAMEGILKRNSKLEIHGCDISDFLIQKAVELRNLPKDRFQVCDATNMPCYSDSSFDYAYTIGSLEHFSQDGIDRLLRETARIVRKKSFHMMPVSRSGKNEGWLKTYQSFYNNSVDWWLEKFRKHFETVFVFHSAWSDELSVGKWFVTSGSAGK